MAKSIDWKLLAIAVVAVVAGGGFWLLNKNGADDNLVFANGRIEAEEVQVAAKYPGRVKEIFVDEGDMVAAGQLLAVMDSEELEAQIAQAEAEVHRLHQVAEQARAATSQAEAELKLADRELQREQKLFRDGYTTEEVLDLRRTKKETLMAAVSQAHANVRSAEAAIQSASAAVTRLQTQLKETELKATVQGRVLYRLAEPGEILGGGGRVLTLLDVTKVYMTIFLPAEQAGRLSLGSEARLVLDPLPDRSVPAKVVFVSPQAQFTPKQVETEDERQKLMFRVKLEIPRALLQQNVERVKTGVRGVAYLRLDETVDWPEHLQLRPIERQSAPDEATVTASE